MGKYRIESHPENCTGCRRCQLACSDLHTKTFNPSMARIRVKMVGTQCSITFIQECEECGICVDDCFFGSLQKIPREGTE